MVTTKDVHPSNLELILAQMYKVEHHLHHFYFLLPSDRLAMSLYTVHRPSDSSQSAVDSDLCVAEVKAVCVCALTFRWSWHEGRAR